MPPRRTKDDIKVDHLYHFDPSVIEEHRVGKRGPCTIVMVGARGTGKSTLIEDLMRKCKNVPRGLIITGTRAAADNFSKFFPKICILDAKNPGLLDRINDIIKEQQKYVKKIKKGDTTTDYSMFILFDDCGYDKKLVNNITMNELFMNGRHYKIMIIMAIQFAKSIPPSIRINVDYLFVMREPGISPRKKLFEEYAGIAKKFDIFCEIMDKCTTDYGCLVIDKTVQANDITDALFYYKANIDKSPFRVGMPQLWEYQDKYYKSSDDEDSDDEDSIVIKKKPKAIKNKR